MAALNKAISERRFKQARCFIASGVNVNSKCKNGNTALIQLCFVEQDSLAISIATCLLKRGAKIDAKDSNGLTALSTAVLMQKENMVALFLEEAWNFDLNSKDKRGNTALLHAANIGNFNILNSLIVALKKYQLSVDVTNNAGFTALIEACRNGNIDCANYLIKEGKASMNIRDKKYRRTALEWAKIKGISEDVLLSNIDSSSRAESMFDRDKTDVKMKENIIEGTGRKEEKCEKQVAENRKTNASYKDQFRHIYRVYECQLTASFKPGKRPKPKLLQPIEEQASSPRNSARSRYFSKSKSSYRLLKRASLEKTIIRRPPHQKFQRSQSFTDLTKLDVKESEGLESLPSLPRSRSARSGRVRQVSESPTVSRTASASSTSAVIETSK